ncbi:hypothetical protein CWT12_06390 [Actinomyces sp. 432]|uniref:hypothetical protein n=1 Tax=Actinomyces sp. 432 TaxID=2057798 RepID=UPI0013739F09|nr:hypothetical protein [Actinomyces sp. 432]QHO91017.1 hypothetical protein CWT12_06390 [Actinomyces sp. 432]
MDVRIDLIVSVVVAALGSPLLLSVARAARRSWMQRRDIETEVQRWRRQAAAWETACWATRSMAVQAGVPVERLPRGPGEGSAVAWPTTQEDSDS